MPSLTHLALHVSELDSCIEFYRSFCGLQVTHRRGEGDHRVVWMAEPGREDEFVFVLLAGGVSHEQAEGDFSHLGFACATRDEVDEVARRGGQAGCLLWPPRQEPYPVGYYCGLKDPSGNFVELSYGQPLGPGAEESRAAALRSSGPVES
jgi:catechol 2,3-dioxygenase-like lactoylglutathione lyase family enzyme